MALPRLPRAHNPTAVIGSGGNINKAQTARKKSRESIRTKEPDDDALRPAAGTGASRSAWSSSYLNQSRAEVTSGPGDFFTDVTRICRIATVCVPRQGGLCRRHHPSVIPDNTTPPISLNHGEVQPTDCGECPTALCGASGIRAAVQSRNWESRTGLPTAELLLALGWLGPRGADRPQRRGRFTRSIRSSISEPRPGPRNYYFAKNRRDSIIFSYLYERFAFGSTANKP